MHLVSDFEQIMINIMELENGRASIGQDLDEYKKLIKKGTCFMPYRSANGIAFAPSRFIGYLGNKLSTHKHNEGRDGRDTNKVINSIIGHPPKANSILEKYYLGFCEENGITPSKTGAFGVERKYWLSSDMNDLTSILDDLAINEIQSSLNITDTEREQLTMARVGQGIFRKNLIEAWKTCCVSGCDYTPVLRASHIKPWSLSTNDERLDVNNGLLLIPNLDVLFDKGLISFEDSGEMLISPVLTEDVIRTLGCGTSIRVKLRAGNIPYISWHRENLFISSSN